MDAHRRQRLARLIKTAYNGSQAAFVAETGISKGRVSQLVGSDEPFGERAAKSLVEKINAAGRLHLPDRYFEIDSDMGGEVDQAPELRGDRRVPVVGEVKGGDDGYLDEMQYPIGHGEGFVEYPTSDTSAYALRVRGDSMHPRYRAGEFIVVEPSIEAQPGDDVVVSLVDGRKLLKELNWIRDGEVQLLSVNNHFGPLTIPLSDVNFIQLVAGRVRRSAFHKT